MPRQLVPVSYSDYSGGMNDDLDPTELKLDEMALIRNWWWNGSTLQERPGLTKVNATAISGTPAIQGIVDFSRNEGADQDLVTAAGGNVYSGTSTLLDITGTISITSGANKLWTFTTYQDVLIAAGEDAPWKWTGSGNIAALAGSPPTGKYIATKWNYLFLGGIPTDLGLVRYADLNTFETWSGGNTIRVRTYGDDFMTGLVPFGDMVLALCQNSIQRITYTGDAGTPFANDTLLEGIGCPHQRSFVKVDDRAYFIDQHFRIRKIVPSSVIAAYEVPDLSTRKLSNTLDGLDLSRRPYICGAYFRPFNSVVWFVSRKGSSTNDYCIVLNLSEDKSKFAVFDSLSVNAVTPYRDGTSRKLYLGNYAGRIHSLEGNDDDGTAIATQVTSRWEDQGHPELEKSVREVRTETIQPGGSALTMKTYANYSPTVVNNLTVKGNTTSSVTATKWGTATWGGTTWPAGSAAPQLVYRKMDTSLIGELLRIEFSSSPTGATPRKSLCRYTLMQKAQGAH